MNRRETAQQLIVIHMEKGHSYDPLCIEGRGSVFFCPPEEREFVERLLRIEGNRPNKADEERDEPS